MPTLNKWIKKKKGVRWEGWGESTPPLSIFNNFTTYSIKIFESLALFLKFTRENFELSFSPTLFMAAILLTPKISKKFVCRLMVSIAQCRRKVKKSGGKMP